MGSKSSPAFCDRSASVLRDLCGSKISRLLSERPHRSARCSRQTGPVPELTRILVVDDEPYLADLVATALRYEGFEAAVAGSGRAALAGVEEFRPDLLVLDI